MASLTPHGKVDEAAFESFICDHLLAQGGYDAVHRWPGDTVPPSFDPILGLDRVELWSFIVATQLNDWNTLIKLHGGDPNHRPEQVRRTPRQGARCPGFDQPLLYAMYVDKPLTGLAAVQTLSRLNRLRDGKDGTFVLDFRNDAEDVRSSFEPWYGKTVAPPTDPNLLYDTRHALDEFDVLWPDEIERAVALLLASTIDHGRVHAALTPAIDRFNALDNDERLRFVDALRRFTRTYSFLSQVVAFTDVKLERDYLFAKALGAFVSGGGGASLDLGSEVELTHLRIEQSFSGSVTLTETEGEVSTIFGGTGKIYEPDEEPLSRIIERLNERFGTSWDPADRVFYDAIAEKLSQRPEIQQAAAANSAENFALVLAKEFQGATDSGQGRGRPPGALPDHRTARARPREPVARVQGDAADPRRDWRVLQATRVGDPQDHRRLPQQPGRRHPPARCGR